MASSVLVSSLVSDSLLELNVIQPGEPLSAGNAAFGVGRLNLILDNWNAIREAVYAEEFVEFTFVPNQQDYTIGPDAADFTVASRPVAIDGANVILDNVDPVVTNTINLRDWQWWLNLTVRAVTTTFPTDVYYEPNWPNGVLHFWPKPTTSYGLQLAVRSLLSQVTVSTVINLPPGYHSALMLTLAEDMATSFKGSVPATTEKKAREARSRIFANNTFIPSLQTQDAGMPSNRRNQCTFNYKSGTDINVNR